MIRCVMFDLDGTLCDTLQDLAEACNHALRQGGYPEHPIEAYKLMVGNGITRLIQRALPQSAAEEAVIASREAMLAYYREHLMVHTRPYPGMEQLVESLYRAEYGLYVVTNKPDAQAKTIVEALFPGRFAGITGQLPDKPTKPDPWAVTLYREAGAYGKDECLYVGDSNVDAQTALAAGVPCAGVTWGFRTRQELQAAGARWVVDTAEELMTVIQGQP